MIPRQANELIRAARKTLGLTQAGFAGHFKKTQGEISKYENGTIAPPADICMQCVHILLEKEMSGMPTVDLINRQLEMIFSGPEHTPARQLIMDILAFEIKKSTRTPK